MNAILGNMIRAVCICASFNVSIASADFSLNDISSAIGQVKRALPNGNGTRSSAAYIPPGMGITLEGGRRAKAYGYDCQPNERQPCGSIKVSAGAHKVMIVPLSGKSFDERWTFKKLEGEKLVAIRPDGTILEANIE